MELSAGDLRVVVDEPADDPGVVLDDHTEGDGSAGKRDPAADAVRRYSGVPDPPPSPLALAAASAVAWIGLALLARGLLRRAAARG